MLTKAPPTPRGLTSKADLGTVINTNLLPGQIRRRGLTPAPMMGRQKTGEHQTHMPITTTAPPQQLPAVRGSARAQRSPTRSRGAPESHPQLPESPPRPEPAGRDTRRCSSTSPRSPQRHPARPALHFVQSANAPHTGLPSSTALWRPRGTARSRPACHRRGHTQGLTAPYPLTTYRHVGAGPQRVSARGGKDC